MASGCRGSCPLGTVGVRCLALKCKSRPSLLETTLATLRAPNHCLTLEPSGLEDASLTVARADWQATRSKNQEGNRQGGRGETRRESAAPGKKTLRPPGHTPRHQMPFLYHPRGATIQPLTEGSLNSARSVVLGVSLIHSSTLAEERRNWNTRKEQLWSGVCPPHS